MPSPEQIGELLGWYDTPTGNTLPSQADMAHTQLKGGDWYPASLPYLFSQDIPHEETCEALLKEAREIAAKHQPNQAVLGFCELGGAFSVRCRAKSVCGLAPWLRLELYPVPRIGTGRRLVCLLPRFRDWSDRRNLEDAFERGLELAGGALPADLVGVLYPILPQTFPNAQPTTPECLQDTLSSVEVVGAGSLSLTIWMLAYGATRRLVVTKPWFLTGRVLADGGLEQVGCVPEKFAAVQVVGDGAAFVAPKGVQGDFDTAGSVYQVLRYLCWPRPLWRYAQKIRNANERLFDLANTTMFSDNRNGELIPIRLTRYMRTAQGGPVREVTVSEDTISNHRGLMALVGEAGTGKSTCLRRLAWRMADTYLKSDEPNAPIPALVSLAELVPHLGRGSWVNAVSEHLMAHYPGLWCDHNADNLHDVVLLVDGWDKVGNARLWEAVQQQSGMFRAVILASRHQFKPATNNNIPTVTLALLTSQEIRDYLKHIQTKTNDVILDLLRRDDPRVASLRRRMVLRLVTALGSGASPSLTLFLEQAVKGLLNLAKHHLDRSVLIETPGMMSIRTVSNSTLICLLEHLAWKFQCTLGLGRLTHDSLAQYLSGLLDTSRFKGLPGSEIMLEFFRRQANLMCAWEEQGQDLVSFVHESFQEVLAARFFLNNVYNSGAEEIASSHEASDVSGNINAPTWAWLVERAHEPAWQGVALHVGLSTKQPALFCKALAMRSRQHSELQHVLLSVLVLHPNAEEPSGLRQQTDMLWLKFAESGRQAWSWRGWRMWVQILQRRIARLREQITLPSTLGEVERAKALAHDPEASQALANALGNLGWALNKLGESHRAIDIHSEEVALIRLMCDDLQPDATDAQRQHIFTLNAEALISLATALGALGATLYKLGEYGRATQAHDEEVSLKRLMCSDLQPNATHIQRQCALEHYPDALRGLAIALGNLGLALNKLGKRLQAVEVLKEMLQLTRLMCGNLQPNATHIQRQLTLSDNFDAVRILAIALGKIGSVLDGLGRSHEAVKFLKEMLQLTRLMCSDLQPNATHIQRQCALEHYPDALRGLAIALGNLGLALNKLGKRLQAVEVLKEMLQLTRLMCGNLQPNATHIQRAKAFENQPDALRILAMALSNLSLVCSQTEEYCKAVELHDEEVSLKRLMCGDLQPNATDLQRQHIFKHYPDALRGLVIALGNMGAAFNRLGEYCKAVESLEEMLQLARLMCGNLQPTATDTKRSSVLNDHPDALNSLITALANLGSALGDTKQSYKAIDIRGEEVALKRLMCGNLQPNATDIERREAFEHYPGELRFLADALGAHGSAFYKLERYDQSVDVHCEEVKLKRLMCGNLQHQATDAQRTKAFENYPDALRALSVALGRLGLALSNTERYGWARSIHDEEVTLKRLMCGNLQPNATDIERREAFEHYPGELHRLAVALGKFGLVINKIKPQRKAVEVLEEMLQLARLICGNLQPNATDTERMKAFEHHPGAMRILAMALERLSLAFDGVGQKDKTANALRELFKIAQLMCSTNTESVHIPDALNHLANAYRGLQNVGEIPLAKESTETAQLIKSLLAIPCPESQAV